MLRHCSRLRFLARYSMPIALVLSASIGCGDHHSPTNALLISIDSLRADHLGSYGYHRETSPTLDRLAAEGTRFDNALSSTSWTLPAHVTLLTGREQHHHQTVTPADKVPASEELLAEALSRQGHETVGFYSGPFLHPTYGFGRGFESYLRCRGGSPQTPAGGNLSHSDETNPGILAAVEAWLESRSARPFFAFIHMWDVHYDYIPPEPYRSMFDEDYGGPLDGRRIENTGFPLSATPRDVEHLIALYDGEIRYTDETIEKILQLLETAGLLQDTLVVVTADHGEEFLDHGRKGHQESLFEEMLRVPLIFWGPDVPKGRTVTRPVSLADVGPTILDLMGVTGLEDADGQTLRPLLRRGTLPPSPVFSALYTAYQRPTEIKLVSVRKNQTKLIYSPRKNAWAQYDLASDPGELKSLPADPALMQTLLSYMGDAAAGLASRPDSNEAQVPEGLPSELVEELRALGYLE